MYYFLYLFVVAQAGCHANVGLAGGVLNLSLPETSIKATTYQGVYTGNVAQLRELTKIVTQGKVCLNILKCKYRVNALCIHSMFPLQSDAIFFKFYVLIRIKLSMLKGLAQAKIIKKSVILFRVLNMTI